MHLQSCAALQASACKPAAMACQPRSYASSNAAQPLLCLYVKPDQVSAQKTAPNRASSAVTIFLYTLTENRLKSFAAQHALAR